MPYTEDQQKLVKTHTGHDSVKSFLDYCVSHSKTPRALFSPGNLFAIYSLAAAYSCEYLEVAKSWKELAESKEKRKIGDFQSADLISTVDLIERYNNEN
ncbi:hypothetical protein COB87_002365 [Candidatus Wolfebacteria bacterium]|nr:hypothetical protein [Candidatus Wolfebacteria bacterium]